MDTAFLLASLANLLIGVAYTVTSLIAGVLAIKFVDRYLLRKVDIEQELKANNVAVAIFASSLLFFVAIIISFGLRG